ncbi:UNVERIFIED_CONTAM: hypothetical protein K2H54_004539 [Gekko kuhli]
MMFLFTLLVVLPLLGTLRADQDEVAELERRSDRDADRVQDDIPGMQRREDDEDDYVLMCTRDTRRGCVKVRLADIGKGEDLPPFLLAGHSSRHFASATNEITTRVSNACKTLKGGS